MSFKQNINSLLGRTSSSSVNIIEKTHFTGKYFRKVVDIENSTDLKAKDAKKMDRYYPESAPHKPNEWDYRFHFKLDLNIRPQGMKIGDLINSLNSSKNYKALVKLYGPSGLTNENNEDECFTGYMGYKLSDWLEIETGYAHEGEFLDYLGRDGIDAFPVSYKDVYELHDEGNISVEMRIVTVKDSDVNLFVQQILKYEVEIFLKECLKAMSPS